MRQVYLDYAATTPVKEEVLAEMLPYFTEKYGNPSSLHMPGESARADVQIARKRVADLIGAEEKEIFFTSSGTEADNWSVIGTARAHRNRGKHIITSKIEHHALLHTCQYLEKDGYTVTYLNVDNMGRIDPASLEQAITDQTILISIMFANNEVGTIQPIKELASIAKRYGILFHTDAVQALGNVPLDVKDLNIDLMSISSHKIYGPKGVGALYIKNGVKIDTFMHGGQQESGQRSGTVNVPGIIGFGKAAELAKEGLDDHIKKLTELKKYFIKGVLENIPDVDVNGDPEHSLPGTINLAFNGAAGTAIRLYMNKHGIAASSGSACTARSEEPSHVLQAMGFSKKKVSSSTRFTIGEFTTMDDLDFVINKLIRIVSGVRQMDPLDIC